MERELGHHVASLSPREALSASRAAQKEMAELQRRLEIEQKVAAAKADRKKASALREIEAAKRELVAAREEAAAARKKAEAAAARATQSERGVADAQRAADDAKARAEEARRAGQAPPGTLRRHFNVHTRRARASDDPHRDLETSEET